MADRARGEQKRSLFYRLIYLAVLGLIIFTVVTVYLHFSYGWFTKNESVSAEGMKTAVNDEALFELAVRDRDGTPDNDQRTPYDADSRIAEYLAREENGGYEKLDDADPSYITSNEHTAILCHLVNENPHEENSEDLAPGAFGKISFDIVLKGGYDADFDVALSFYPLGIAANGDPTPIVDPDETDPAVQAEQEELLTELQEMLSGHVLFYKTRSALINGGYYYSDRLTDDAFTFELPAAPDYPDPDTGDRYYTVEIYWIWPATFGQLALETDSPMVHAHPVYNDETERGEILTYISTHPGKFFRNLAIPAATAFAAADYPNYYFVELSEGYNHADQLIGDNTHFLIVCVDVEPAGAAD